MPYPFGTPSVRTTSFDEIKNGTPSKTALFRLISIPTSQLRLIPDIVFYLSGRNGAKSKPVIPTHEFDCDSYD